MNEYQLRAKNFLDEQIGQLENGIKNLQESQTGPTEVGNIYNGMLKSSVNFEIQHMRKIRDQLIEILQ